MFLSYEIQVSRCCVYYSSSNSAGFEYTRRIKGLEVSDCVKAIADGALILKTNKTMDPDKFLIDTSTPCPCIRVNLSLQPSLIEGKEP